MPILHSLVMFGGSKELVASLLKDHVGKYVEIDTDNVALSLWDGVVELENLELKPEALKSLNLPIKVVSGRISKYVFMKLRSSALKLN